MNAKNDSRDLVNMTCHFLRNYVKEVIGSFLNLFGLQSVKRFIVKNAENRTNAYQTLDFFSEMPYNSNKRYTNCT